MTPAGPVCPTCGAEVYLVHRVDQRGLPLPLPVNVWCVVCGQALRLQPAPQPEEVERD